MGKTEGELVDCIKHAIIKSGKHFDSNEIGNIIIQNWETDQQQRPPCCPALSVSITTLWTNHQTHKSKKQTQTFPRNIIM